MPSVTVLEHPLLRHKLSLLRDKDTTTAKFRQVAREINRRLCGLFLPRQDGSAPWQGDNRIFTDDPHWRGLKCFNEYFHADTGRGCGADHQTGWTALIARCMRDRVTGEFSEDSQSSTESR